MQCKPRSFLGIVPISSPLCPSGIMPCLGMKGSKKKKKKVPHVTVKKVTDLMSTRLFNIIKLHTSN